MPTPLTLPARVEGVIVFDLKPRIRHFIHSLSTKYGLGGVRNTSKFYELYGIDVLKKTTQRHLCQFVRNRMHKMFMKHLRPDDMGIDYSNIDFKWVDPRPKDP